MLPYLPMLRPGQAPTAAEWNTLVAYLSQAMGTTSGVTGGGIGLARRLGGTQVLDGRPEGHWARVTAHGTGGFYAHNAVAPKSDGTWEDLPQDAENPYGTATEVPAVEVTGNADVPVDGTAIVWAWPNDAVPGWNFEYAGGAGGSGVTGFFARLTTASSGKWKWYALTLDSGGAFVDDGSESASFNATPLKLDGTNLCNPVAGLRVWMLASKQSGLYEFLPTGYAASGLPGVVSITSQTFSGAKTFESVVQVTTGGPGIATYGSVTWSLRCADAIECSGALLVTGNDSGSALGFVAIDCAVPATARYVAFSGYGAFPPDNVIGVFASSPGPSGTPSGVPAFEILAGHKLFIRSPEISVDTSGSARKTCLNGTYDVKDGAGVTRYFTFEGGFLVDWS